MLGIIGYPCFSPLTCLSSSDQWKVAGIILLAIHMFMAYSGRNMQIGKLGHEDCRRDLDSGSIP